MLLSFPYIFIFFPISRLFSLLVIPIILFYFLTIVFIKNKNYDIGRINLILSGSLAVFLYASSFGKNFNIQNLLVVFSCLPTLIFSYKERQKITISSLIPFLLYILLEVTNYNYGINIIVQSQIYIRVISPMIFITTLLSMYSLTFYFSTISQKSEKKATESYLGLEQANKKIKANTKQELYLNMARGLQAQFLPDIPKKIKLYGGCYHFETIYKPSNQLSGDLYDFHIKGDMVKIFHGDIVGKNVPAMMVALNVRSELKHLLRTEGAPHVLMDRLNGLIRKIRASMAVCAGVYYELNLKTKEMTYVHMGFEDIYIIRDQGVIDLGEEGGAQLGYIEDIEYKQEKVMLQKGDIIVTLSDGMSDMKNQTGERYSENKNLQEMLRSYVKETPMPSTESLRGWIENEIETYTGELEVYADDISVFIANYQS